MGSMSKTEQGQARRRRRRRSPLTLSRSLPRCERLIRAGDSSCVDWRRSYEIVRPFEMHGRASDDDGPLGIPTGRTRETLVREASTGRASES